MNEFKRYLVTSALPYANGPLHIGHLAGVYVPSDIYTRYLRLRGRDVIHVCGSDEHGVPITIKARQEGVTPRQIVDRYHEMNKSSFEKFGIAFDIYSRTSNEVHYQTASEIFRTLYDRGEFVEKTTPQYYDTEAGQFLADRYIQGTCPRCGNESAYGDQCERCGTSLSPTDLANPRSALSGSTPVMKETKHWYLALDKYEPFLKKWILEGKKHWKANVYGQCKSWLDHGLQPRAVSRDLEWGIPVPLEDAEGKVLYVWFDAPIGYISATKELTPDWEKYWKDSETRLIHFIGKDNIVFHCIVFPSMLNAEGSFILPDNVPANEFLNLENDKISTSRNWAVWLHEYLEDFPGKQDVLRYVLCANAPETKDNDFTWKDFQSRNNNELVAIYGNFINRAMVLTQKYFDGMVPGRGELTQQDRQVLDEIPKIKEAIENSLEQFRFREALKEAMNLARLGNKYLADTEPWKIFNTDPERVRTILNIALQISASLSVVTMPFLPDSAFRLMDFLKIGNIPWDRIGDSDIMAEGHVIGSGGLLFEKISDEEIDKQIQKLLANPGGDQAPGAGLAEPKSNISYDEFSALDIRIGTITGAERVPKTKKLLKLTIDTGIDIRTVVSGIAGCFEPEAIIGRQVSVLVNLEPRDIRGIRSQGMILMAEDPGGNLVFVSPESSIENGSVVK
jgi:methionyl-tRNA synthetase